MRSFSLELRYTLFSFELSEFLELGFFVKRSFYFRKNPFALSFPPFGEIVVLPFNIGKTLKIRLISFLMSSISVRFHSCSSLIRFSMIISPLPRVVGLDGFEPSTSRLSGARSNHLSYKPFSFGFLGSLPSG